jgi:hypothetical protein
MGDLFLVGCALRYRDEAAEMMKRWSCIDEEMEERRRKGS